MESGTWRAWDMAHPILAIVTLRYPHCHWMWEGPFRDANGAGEGCRLADNVGFIDIKKKNPAV